MRLQTTISDDLYKLLCVYAGIFEINMNEYVRRILEEGVKFAYRDIEDPEMRNTMKNFYVRNRKGGSNKTT